MGFAIFFLNIAQFGLYLSHFNSTFTTNTAWERHFLRKTSHVYEKNKLILFGFRCNNNGSML